MKKYIVKEGQMKKLVEWLKDFNKTYSNELGKNKEVDQDRGIFRDSVHFSLSYLGLPIEPDQL